MFFPLKSMPLPSSFVYNPDLESMMIIYFHEKAKKFRPRRVSMEQLNNCRAPEENHRLLATCR